MLELELPRLEELGFGAGMEYMVPRLWYWKFFFRWIWTVGGEVSLGEDVVVMDVRRRVGLPHDGQNFLEGSLQILLSDSLGLCEVDKEEE